MRGSAPAVEPLQALHGAGKAHENQRQRRKKHQDRKDGQARNPPQRRKPQPQPEPGDRQKQAENGRDRSERGPDPFPENGPAGTAQRVAQQQVAGRFGQKLILLKRFGAQQTRLRGAEKESIVNILTRRRVR